MDKIPIGSVCMVDVENLAHQKEPSIKFVQIMNVIKESPFRIEYRCLALNEDMHTPIEVCNQDREDESPKEWLIVKVDHRYLKPLQDGDHIILRYPYWMPEITHGDLAAVDNAIKMLQDPNHFKDPKIRKMWVDKLCAFEVKLDYFLKMKEV